MSRLNGLLGARGIMGLLLVGLGALLLLSDFFPYRFQWEDYWPVLLIIWGGARLANQRGQKQGFSIALIIIGAWFLLDNTTPYLRHLDWSTLWPSALIVFGVYLIIRNMRSRPANVSSLSEQDTISVFALLGGSKTLVNSQDFRGGDATAILGGCEIDLRQAKLAKTGESVVIDATAVLGGVEIHVPSSWEVILRGTPILGSIEDQRTGRPAAGTESSGGSLVIEGLALMGGVEIKD